MSGNPPDPIRRGLYLHLPFCRRKCRYCGFFTLPAREQDFAPFVEALLREIEAKASRYPEPLDTVFIGGGTPSTLPVPLWHRLLQALQVHFRFREPVEWTVEMNPESVTPDLLALFRDFGIHRISLGVQSAHDEELEILGRIHDRATAERAISWIHEYGFENFNLDLIFGIPGQSLESWIRSLEWAVQQGPTHLSTYHLTIEKGSVFDQWFQQGRLTLPDAQTVEAMYRVREEVLGAHGYQRYEISNFAKPGYECRHNRIYWEHQEYLGLGPSAASFLYTSDISARRWRNVQDLLRYLQNPCFTEEDESLGISELITERIFLGIRLREGIPFRRAWIPEAVQPFVTWEKGRVRLNQDGVLVADRIAVELVSALEERGAIHAETLRFLGRRAPDPGA